MKVIAHQAEGMDLPAGFAARLAEGRQKRRAVPVLPENRLPPVPTIHHMINRPGIFHS